MMPTTRGLMGFIIEAVARSPAENNQRKILPCCHELLGEENKNLKYFTGNKKHLNIRAD